MTKQELLEINNGDPIKAATQLLRTLASEDDKHPTLIPLATEMAVHCKENGLNSLSELLRQAAKSQGADLPPI